MGRSTAHTWNARLLACVVVIAGVLAVAAPARAVDPPPDVDDPPMTLAGATVENTDPDSPPLLSEGAPPEVRAEAPVPALGVTSTAGPEDDLAAALDRLAAAATAADAQAEIALALAILDGTGVPELADRAYEGIPLLNAGPAAANVRDVPGGGTVEIREVRFGDQAVFDTAGLRFLDPTAPFTIRWKITEVGRGFGRLFAPTVLLSDGAERAGQHQALEPLGGAPVAVGRDQISRFHPAPGAAEETRVVTRTVDVDMPPAGRVRAIVDPSLTPGQDTFGQIVPAADLRPAADVDQIAAGAPERQIHDGLAAMDPVGALRTAKTQAAALRALVGAMRSRHALPGGSGAPEAELQVVVMNNEAYVSAESLHVPPGASLTVGVVNLDGVARTLDVVDVVRRERIFGALDWGRFAWSKLGEEPLAAGASATLTVTPSPEARALMIADPGGGAQAGVAVSLDRGPRQQALRLGDGAVLPVHQSFDPTGALWVALSGRDEIARVTPSADLAASAVSRLAVPGGLADPATGPHPANAAVLQGPFDVQSDGRGIVWATLLAGDAIARIDPSAAEDGTTKGIRVYPLAPCDETCRRHPVPEDPKPLLRNPAQMTVTEDGGGNTVIFFTELQADRIGVLRVAPDGTKLTERHFACGCSNPLGIALDAGGDLWFTEGLDSRLGRISFDQARPYDEVTVTIRHYKIPSFTEEFVPGCAPGEVNARCPLGSPVRTALPHSLAIDRAGRVWFAGEATDKIGYLDPAKATPDTTDGMVEADTPLNDFRRPLAPADMVIDRAGEAFIADEYGDGVGRAHVGAGGELVAEHAFATPERNGLSDSPITDPAGDLWYIDGGANQITRVSGVTAGLPLPTRAPLITADLRDGSLAAMGLAELTSVDLRLRRGPDVAWSRDGVAADGGTFGLTDVPLAADDVLEVIPRGPVAPAPFSFRVPRLDAAIALDGAVHGTALAGGAPLFDRVEIVAGGARGSAAISPADGSFSWSAGLDGAAGASVAFTAASPSARFRTVAGVATAVGAGEPALGPAGSAPPPQQQRQPQGQPRPTPRRRACATDVWLERTGRGRAARRTVPLLGLRAATVTACLGRPGRVRRSAGDRRWSYPGVAFTLRSGRVTAFTLTTARVRSAPDGAAAGGRMATFRLALGRLVRDDRGWRAIVRAGSRYADIRLAVRHGLVRRVSVTLRSARQLDRAGRALARAGR
jgi:hypothetical protein